MLDNKQCGGSGALPLASLNHISFLCRSLEKSVSFYQDVLGFFPVHRPGSFGFDGAWDTGELFNTPVLEEKFLYRDFVLRHNADVVQINNVSSPFQRLFNYGIGIHLLQTERLDDVPVKTEINPMDNHISFQCESMVTVETRLKNVEIQYVKRRVEEGGVYVDQLFFHDPDGFMIEICNCENLPVVPLAVNGEQQMNNICKSVNFVKNQQQCHSEAVLVQAKEEPRAACT